MWCKVNNLLPWNGEILLFFLDQHRFYTIFLFDELRYLFEKVQNELVSRIDEFYQLNFEKQLFSKMNTIIC
ncbi:MAG: hypothetical protein RBT49_05220 [Bacteroidales bacterium]|nr:hypothetical protein [Bacteroidales bacterium]